MMTRIDSLKGWIWMLIWHSSLTMLLIWMKRMNLKHLENILKILKLKIENRSSRLLEESLEVSMMISNFKSMRMIKKDRREWMRLWIGWKRDRRSKDKIYILIKPRMRMIKKTLTLNIPAKKKRKRKNLKYKVITSLSRRSRQWLINF